MLSQPQVDRFIEQGFLRLDGGFSPQLAARCREILWRASGCREDDRATWTKPVIRIGEIPNPLFVEAASTPRLQNAYDALVGPDRWLPRGSLGTFPIRFPSSEDPGDCGWHIDASFGFEGEPNFLEWRTNIASKGRALLMLFLFSDVSEADAPTRIRVGSHVDIARRLAPYGDAGLTLGELASTGFSESALRPEVLAVGDAGTVYLCHPFLVHAAQLHRGTQPRFLAQPPLLPKGTLDARFPVARAIAQALQR